MQLSRRSAAGLPACVLVDTGARIGRRTNATTARAVNSAGRAIEVSFELAEPPGLSRCFVHCPPDLTRARGGGHGEPWPRASVTGSDGAFLLIAVTYPNDGSGRRWPLTDVFVYRAGPGAPSLHLLPRPYPRGLLSTHVGVLSAGDGRHCLVVIPEERVQRDGRTGYGLEIFSTETGSWTAAEVASVAPDLEWQHDAGFYHTKAFSVGGTAPAWADLRRGILLCENLLGGGDTSGPSMRLVQLPPPMPANSKPVLSYPNYYGSDEPPLDPIRDVAFADGGFTFVETEMPDQSGGNERTRLRWTATVFRTTICSSEGWELCGAVDSAQLPRPADDDSCSPAPPGRLPFPDGIWDDREGRKLALDRVITQIPTLDASRDGVVYLISKLNADDPRGWVLAVDAGSQKLEKVAPFSLERLYANRTYMQCAFSKYFSNVR